MFSCIKLATNLSVGSNLPEKVTEYEFKSMMIEKLPQIELQIAQIWVNQS